YITFFYWSNVSDRYVYFFMLAFIITIALISRYFTFKKSLRGILSLLIILSVLSFNYGLKFNNPLKLYEEIVEYKPHPVLYSLLFEQYLMKLDLENCKKILNEAVRRFPNDPQLLQDQIRIKSLETLKRPIDQ
ncbi:MAG: hypothetical protein Q7U04_05605, partial [Bacteriovorax sp.]|nr:hypothetical protein [Bacteriovorax sp.]